MMESENHHVAFVANAGHANKEMLYHTDRSDMFLTRNEIIFVLNQPSNKKQVSQDSSGFSGERFVSENEGTVQLALSLQFLSTNIDSRVVARERMQGTVNIFKGNNPNNWSTNLPVYAEIVYEELWTGIDMVLTGSQGNLKYNFIVKPGARVEDIRLSYQGVQSISIDAEGNLTLSTPLGIVLDEKPISYQVRNGISFPVESQFVLAVNDSGAAIHGFKVGDYRADLPLIIDPGLTYSTYLGGNLNETGNGIAVDNDGNVYVTGFTNSPDFPVTIGVVQRDLKGPFDAYVTKFNAAGQLVYSTYLGGSNSEVGFGITVDGNGNAYVTGYTLSADFPVTLGVFQSALIGTTDAFVTKLNATGTRLIYSTYLGGGTFLGVSQGHGIRVDNTGNAFITGFTTSPDFPTTIGVFQPGFHGTADGFVTKLNSTGTNLVYSTYLGGGYYDYAYGIAIDDLGNAYITGSTTSADFPTTTGAFQTSKGDGFNSAAFVTKLNGTGTRLLYSTFLTGTNFLVTRTSDDVGRAIAVDRTGNAYVTGFTESPDFPTTFGAFLTRYPGGMDAVFVTILNNIGSGINGSTFLGGSYDDRGFGIAIDDEGNAYVAGYTSSNNFPTTQSAFQPYFLGGYDAFVTKLNHDLSTLLYSTFLGGTRTDYAFGIAINQGRNVYVSGYTESPTFPTTPGAFQTFLRGASDAFYVKFDLLTNLSLEHASSSHDAARNGNFNDNDPAVAADLLITQSLHDTYVIIGDLLQHKIRVRNLGPNTARQIHLQEQLPQVMEFVRAQSNRGRPHYHEGILDVHIDTLEQYSSIIVTVTLRPSVEGTFVIEGTVTAKVFDPNLDNNSATSEIVVANHEE
jgi:uncharacterized repeat protein (TIGR01451 family)